MGNWDFRDGFDIILLRCNSQRGASSATAGYSRMSNRRRRQAVYQSSKAMTDSPDADRAVGSDNTILPESEIFRA